MIVQEDHLGIDGTGGSLENAWYRRVSGGWMVQEGHWRIDGTGDHLGIDGTGGSLEDIMVQEGH